MLLLVAGSIQLLLLLLLCSRLLGLFRGRALGSVGHLCVWDMRSSQRSTHMKKSLATVTRRKRPPIPGLSHQEASSARHDTTVR